ncbi:MAG TPA: biotin--[acetyl-CoA-carboxylase] ligase [Pyrinomonadaceae bacterium]|jgi:BirA family biotin operon repressor/biotin-[acetyl-CoA-carboxylase] ligase
MKITILRFDEIGSTNTEALNQARRGADEGLCIVARRQTAGRGRHGRAWISEADAGLYFSIVLRPKLETRFLPLITLMTAVAVHDTLEETYEIDCDIKWANDIHVRDKKICGILAETADTPKGLAVVVGIGINIKSSNFPPEIADIATSIEAETKRKINSAELLEALTRFLDYHYEILPEAGGAEKIRREWTRRSSYAAGKNVRVFLENETISGTTDGIEENGALRVRIETGETRIIQAGDVEKLRREPRF